MQKDKYLLFKFQHAKGPFDFGQAQHNRKSPFPQSPNEGMHSGARVWFISQTSGRASLHPEIIAGRKFSSISYSML